MSVVSYRPFVAVRVEDKDTEGAITALAFSPTSETSRRLANHRLVFRSRRNGFQLYAQYAEGANDAPLAPIRRRTRFRFAISLVESGFRASYEPEFTKETGPSLHLSNIGDADAVHRDGLLHRGDAVSAADGVRIVTTRLAALLTEGGSGEPAAPVEPAGPSEPAEAEPSEPAAPPVPALLADDELAGRGVFGALELLAVPIAGPTPVGGWQFLVAFQRRN